MDVKGACSPGLMMIVLPRYGLRFCNFLQSADSNLPAAIAGAILPPVWMGGQLKGKIPAVTLISHSH